MFLDPMDDFLNAHLRALSERQRDGREAKGCVLFNDEIGDEHFSAAGSEVWAESVGRRLVLLLELDEVAGMTRNRIHENSTLPATIQPASPATARVRGTGDAARAMVQAGDRALDLAGAGDARDGPSVGTSSVGVDRRLGEANLRRGAAHQQVPRPDRRRLADVPGSGNRGDPTESAASLRRLRAGLPAPVALCRDGSGPWPVALGQLRLDDPAVVEGLRGGRPGPIVSIAAADPIGLAEESRDRERDAGVLPRAGRARTGRGQPGHDGRPARVVAADDQLVGPARARARTRCPAPRSHPGRLVHAGDVHRRRRDPARMPAPRLARRE